MRKISGRVVSTKPITLSRAAKLISRFAAVDNGSSPAVSLYLQRTADAFNHLVQFHDKRPKVRNIESSPDRKSIGTSQTDGVEKSLDGDKGKGKDSESRARKRDKKSINDVDATKIDGDEAKDLETSITEKKKKKKKRKSDDGDVKEKSRGKKSRDEAVDL